MINDNVGYRKMISLIDRIQRDDYLRPLGDVLTLLEKYAFRFFEETEASSSEHNVDVAFSILRSISRVIPFILKEDDPTSAAKEFIHNITSYITDNWQDEIVA